MSKKVIVPSLIVIVIAVFFGYRVYNEFINPPVANIQKQLEIMYEEYFSDESDDNDNVAVEVSSYILGIRRARIAIEEYLSGVNGNTPSGRQRVHEYTGGRDIPWCVNFASWVTQQAGSPVGDESNGFRIDNTWELKDWLLEHGTYYDKETLLEDPSLLQVGDILLYSRGAEGQRLGHVFIVVNVRENGNVDTVDGNIQNRLRMLDNLDYMGRFGFMGIGRAER